MQPIKSKTPCFVQLFPTLSNFYQCRVLADRLAEILSGETELALGTIRVKEWPGGALPGTSDLKILNTLFCLGPIVLASGAGSVAILTSFGRKGLHFK